MVDGFMSEKNFASTLAEGETFLEALTGFTEATLGERSEGSGPVQVPS